ncbi:MAG: DUF4286 family protein [Pedobacter sp.]|nr:MAG: DUF4286 family protein [Pedobacter sp.]
MLLYNVTVFVEESIAEEWLNWMQTSHIPEVMAVGLFENFRILKVLDSPNEGFTFCMQYEVASKANYDEYQTVYAPALQAQTAAKFGEKAIAYRTLMEIVG